MNFKRLYKDELSIALNNSDTSVLFTSTRRRQAINDAVEQFADLTECYTAQVNITLSTLTAVYELNKSTSGSSAYVRFNRDGAILAHTDSNGRVTTIGGNDFPQRSRQWLDRYEPGWVGGISTANPSANMTKSKFPRYWTAWNQLGRPTVMLSEVPDIGSSETLLMHVQAVVQPSVLTSTSVEPFDDGTDVRTDLRPYHHALPQYAAYKLLNLIGDTAEADKRLQTFLGYVARYTQNAKPKGGTHTTTARRYYRESRRIGHGSDLADSDSRWGVR